VLVGVVCLGSDDSTLQLLPTVVLD